MQYLQYFDKTFFKFLIGFIAILSVSFAIIIGSHTYFMFQENKLLEEEQQRMIEQNQEELKDFQTESFRAF
jgi:predicted membrane protein